MLLWTKKYSLGSPGTFVTSVLKILLVLFLFFFLPNLWILDYQPTDIFPLKKSYLISRMFSISRSKSWEFQELFMMGAPPSMLRSLYPWRVKFLPLFQTRPRRARSLTSVTVFSVKKERGLLATWIKYSPRCTHT